MPDVEGAMLQAGFKKSLVRELPYDRDTGHFGLAQDFIYVILKGILWNIIMVLLLNVMLNNMYGVIFMRILNY